MFTPLIIAFCVFAIILFGAFAGAVVRRYVPQHHLSEETKNVVSISMAVVATISALVLGLLLSNANSSFSAVQVQVTSISAEILRLDQLLRPLFHRHARNVAKVAAGRGDIEPMVLRQLCSDKARHRGLAVHRQDSPRKFAGKANA